MQGLGTSIYSSYLWCGKLEGQGRDQSGFTLKEVSEVDQLLFSCSICEE